MTWRESDHPRDDEGRFRDKTGRWVTQVSDRLGLPSIRRLMEEGPPDTSYPEIASAFEGRYGSGMTVREVSVHRLGGEDPDAPGNQFSPLGYVDISGEIVADDDPENLQGGYFRVTATQTRREKATDPLYWAAAIDRMHVRGSAQGGGGGRELTDRFIEWFRRSGFDEVTVGPSEVGSYAWPAMGFDFADRESRKIAWEGAMTATVESVRDWFRHYGRSYGMDDSDLTDAQIKKMIGQYKRAASIALAGGMSAQRLSQYGRRRGQGKNDWWAGKLGLLVGGIGGGRIKL